MCFGCGPVAFSGPTSPTSISDWCLISPWRKQICASRYPPPSLPLYLSLSACLCLSATLTQSALLLVLSWNMRKSISIQLSFTTLSPWVSNLGPKDGVAFWISGGWLKQKLLGGPMAKLLLTIFNITIFVDNAPKNNLQLRNSLNCFVRKPVSSSVVTFSRR